MRHVDAELPRELDHRAGHAAELERLARLEILQHRGLVVADGEAGLQPPLERDRQLDAQAGRDGGALLEDRAQELDGLRGSIPSSPSVAPVSALTGLKAALPISLSQI